MTNYEKILGILVIIDFILISFQYAKDKKHEKEMKFKEILEARVKRIQDGNKILNSIPEIEVN